MNTIKHNGNEYVIERDGMGYGALLAEQRNMALEGLIAGISVAFWGAMIAAVIWVW